MRLRTLCLLSFLSLGSAVTAQSQWTQEPAGVFGLPIGGEVTDAIRCAPASTTTCIRLGVPGMPSNMGAIAGLPDLGIALQGSTNVTKDGRISSVSLWFHQRDFMRMVDILRERYGPPMIDTTDVMANAHGAKFPSRTLRWVGAEVILSARERIGRVDQSSVTFSSIELIKREMQERSNANKDASGKF